MTMTMALDDGEDGCADLLARKTLVLSCVQKFKKRRVKTKYFHWHANGNPWTIKIADGPRDYYIIYLTDTHLNNPPLNIKITILSPRTYILLNSPNVSSPWKISPPLILIFSSLCFIFNFYI
jgi:hypothetical protein